MQIIVSKVFIYFRPKRTLYQTIKRMTITYNLFSLTLSLATISKNGLLFLKFEFLLFLVLAPCEQQL